MNGQPVDTPSAPAVLPTATIDAPDNGAPLDNASIERALSLDLNQILLAAQTEAAQTAAAQTAAAQTAAPATEAAQTATTTPTNPANPEGTGTAAR